ncbi:acetyl-CoA acetyltransferase [Hyaloscypha bicolor E]|uniref:Acetyl-CoA acetyltransferase n=1 Tax=Hyaloscypha bicolor E TaxID=1095630 RepID=A0A2J6TH62_9HELO|nr:acetyl-CoA acetyltransferase [Hyaloscypha bicolor E]PMD62376.1 acetyl-CoA acetyltransferase [Hyaloscypha bicolor E]
MAAARRPIPIVVGVGDIKNRSMKIEDAIEPMQLMLQAILKAMQDTNLSASATKELQSKIDSVGVVNTWTWVYPDLPRLISEKLDVKPKYQVLSHHGGDSPAKLFDQAVRRISLGESKVAIVTGGEALASLGACAAAGKLPPPGWTKSDESGKGVSVSDISRFGENPGTLHSVGFPIHVYPLYENAFRAHRRQSIKENNHESAELYADFAKVAEKNPLAWNFGEPAATKEIIGTVSKKNRMICFPYPLLMNAFNNVNLAGACILTSTDYARELGIPEDRWIYPLGGAGTSDSRNFWERPNFHSSAAISKSLDEGLKSSGLTKEQIDIFDFYSCFPIVPKLACQHLGMPMTKQSKPITLLGGLTSFGGAGNNYSMHALIEMVRELRKGKVRNGLVLANGGMVTYQYVVCLSNQPRNSPYPDINPLPNVLDDQRVPTVDEKAEREAVIETYTVEFNRDGSPERGYIVGRLKNGHRFLANEGDENTLKQLVSAVKEQVGRSGFVRKGEDGRNVFIFNEIKKL